MFFSGLHPEFARQAARDPAQVVPDDHGQGVEAVHAMLSRLEPPKNGSKVMKQKIKKIQ
jgi:hypothetical protein